MGPLRVVSLPALWTGSGGRWTGWVDGIVGVWEVSVRALLVTMLSVGCDEVSSVPETSPELAERVNPALAVGQTYMLDPASVQILSPAAFAPLIQGLIGPATVLRGFSVLQSGPNGIDVRFGSLDVSGGAPVQDLCGMTTDLTLRSGPQDQYGARGRGPLWGRVEDIDQAYVDFQVSGRLLPGGASVGDIRYSGLVDLRDWSAVVGSPICALMPAFGVGCVPCPFPRGECIDMTLDGGQAAAVQGLRPLVRVTPASRAQRNCP